MKFSITSVLGAGRLPLLDLRMASAVARRAALVVLALAACSMAGQVVAQAATEPAAAPAPSAPVAAPGAAPAAAAAAPAPVVAPVPAAAAAATAAAVPPSPTTPAAIVGNADAARQKVSMCIGCHGIKGYRSSFPEVYHVPMIAGQNAKYIEAALKEYASGARSHPSMVGIAKSLSDQDIADVAAYYSTLK